MKTTTANWNAAARQVKAKVLIYDDDELLYTLTESDYIKDIKIERNLASGKFFGDVLSQEATIQLIRDIDITNKMYIVIMIGAEDDYIAFPRFYIQEIERNQNTQTTTIKGRDAISFLENLIVDDLQLVAPYTLQEVINAIASTINVEAITYDFFEALEYPIGANLNGNESLRDMVRAAAEVSQTFCQITYDNKLRFARLDSGATPLPLTKNNYFTLSLGDAVSLQTIIYSNELGDSISASTENEGIAQTIYSNPFWDNRDDLADLVDQALINVGDLAIQPYEVRWRGNPATEIGDRISLQAKDNTILYSFLLEDEIYYNGGLSQTSKCIFDANAATANYSTPTTLSAFINQTYAQVDKVNKNITMLVQDGDNTESAISALTLDKDAISAQITRVENDATNAINVLQKNVSEIKAEADALAISFEEGVSSVHTTTGFRFDKDGLNISKSGSEMSTLIDDDGMKIYRNSTMMLKADNGGVFAKDLHATNFLIIGAHSRLEDTASGRTACYWLH